MDFNFFGGKKVDQQPGAKVTKDKGGCKGQYMIHPKSSWLKLPECGKRV